VTDTDERVSRALRAEAEGAAARAATPVPAEVRRAASNRRTAQLSIVATSLVLVAALSATVALAVTQGSGRIVRPSARPTTTLANKTAARSVVVDRAATPPGWTPVAYGLAQISLPEFPRAPTKRVTFPGGRQWGVDYQWERSSVTCSRAQSHGYWAYVGLDSGNCAEAVVESPYPTVMFGPIAYPRTGRGRPSARHQQINGIDVLVLTYGRYVRDYVVPSVGVSLLLSGASTLAIAETLTYSPRAVVLDGGPVVVPAASGSAGGALVPHAGVRYSWRRVAFAGLTAVVPSSWTTNETRIAGYGYGVSVCSYHGVAFDSPHVVLSTDQVSGLDVSCYGPSNATPQVPISSDGLAINSGPLEPTLSMSTACRSIGRLRVCVERQPDFSILVLGVLVPGINKPVEVSIGLSDANDVGRVILASLSNQIPR
jgi:hypothetical protein